MKHPTRVYALSVLTDRTASPKELAGEWGCTIRHMTYHLGVLQELGTIEPVFKKEVRGGRVFETFYRAIRRAWFDRDAWKQIGPKARPPMTATIMELVNEDIARAITANTFDGDENHISRLPMRLDRETYKELIDFLQDTLEKGLFGLLEKAANRIGPDTETVLTVVNIIQFELPPAIPTQPDPGQIPRNVSQDEPSPE